MAEFDLRIRDETRMRSTLTRAMRLRDDDLAIASDGTEAEAILGRRFPIHEYWSRSEGVADFSDENCPRSVGMRRNGKPNPRTLILVVVCAMSCFGGVADGQEERVRFQPVRDDDSRTTPVSESEPEITPAVVFSHVALLREELELIRSAMGKPTNTVPEIDVNGVAPREVFFQAQTLFRKADNLCFEITHMRRTLPEAPTGRIDPSHVRSVVDAALACVRLAKAKLAITTQARRIGANAQHSPTDVFRSIVQANRQLDLLLDRKRSLGELFRQITVGVAYSSRLLGRFPEAERIPAAPPFDPDADLQDVRDRLLECFARLRKIAERSGLELMGLSSGSSGKVGSSASELYEIATIIVSETAYLHASMEDITPPHPVYDPGDKLPAQVYERAGILAAQLAQLQRLSLANPNWLNVSDNGTTGSISGGDRWVSNNE